MSEPHHDADAMGLDCKITESPECTGHIRLEARKIMIITAMSVTPDPFAALGLDRRSDPSAEDVRSAFRQAALLSHPDKGSSNGARFSKLVEARDRALAALQHSTHSTHSTHSMEQKRSPADEERISWAIWVAATVLSCTTARPIEIAVDATLSDLYDARVKRVVIGVVRVCTPHHPLPFCKRRQALLVRLALPARDASVDSCPIVFEGLGDDPPADVLLGRNRNKAKGGRCGIRDIHGNRGDVRVHVRLCLDPQKSPRMHPDSVLCPCDLHATVAISLRGRYLGEVVEVHLPTQRSEERDFSVQAEYSGVVAGTEEEEERGEKAGGGRQVRVFKGRGLPYLSGEPHTAVAGRGDLFVFMEVELPRLDAASLADPEVLRGLDVLSLRACGTS